MLSGRDDKSFTAKTIVTFAIPILSGIGAAVWTHKTWNQTIGKKEFCQNHPWCGNTLRTLATHQSFGLTFVAMSKFQKPFVQWMFKP